MASPLSGVVTKSVLFVRPPYAQHRELLAMTKYKLFEAGFIVIHEEYRRVNEELADTITVQLDREVYESGNAVHDVRPDSAPSAHRLFTVGHANTVPSGVQEMVGHVYLYVLAHRQCHAELLVFVDHLFADAEYTRLLLELPSRTETDSPICPLFCNVTAMAGKAAVQLLFPRMLVHAVPRGSASREYVQAELKGALLPALVELSRAKPEHPIRWLAERLLNTNTRAPPLIAAATAETGEEVNTIGTKSTAASLNATMQC